jgi:transposase
LNLGTITVYVYTSTNRISCPEHGVITTRVPWARQSSGFTKDFENPIAWLALNLSKMSIKTNKCIGGLFNVIIAIF